MLAAGLESTSIIKDMEFLPASSSHASNNVVLSDRVILLTGDLQLPGFGHTSAVLYDGSSFQPYILTSKSDSSSGIIYTLFSQNAQSFSSRGHIRVGWVIVIALAISLFLILLIVIAGLIAARLRRSREGYIPAPGTPPVRETSLERLPPEQLLGEIEERRKGLPAL